jgi:DNA-binding CsgD family transcriptional regulator
MRLNDREVNELRAAAAAMLSPFEHTTVEAWQRATLATVAGLVGVHRGTMITSNGAGSHASNHIGIDDCQWAEYERDWLPIDLREEEAGGAEFLRRGLCAFTRDFLWNGPNCNREQLARYARSAIWNEYYRKYGVTEGAGFGVLLPQQHGPATLVDYLFVFDNDATNPRLRDEGLKLLTVLEPAFRAGSQMARMRGQIQAPLLTSIDALPGAVALLTRAGCYAHQNPTWRRHVARGPDQADIERLASRLALSVVGKGSASTSARRSVVPARVPCGGWLLTATRFEIPGHPAPFALVHADPQAAARTDWHARAADAGLPKRLAQVAALIAEGRSNQEIAGQLSISPSTARRHTERVLARLGAGRRSAVAAVLDATTPISGSRLA